MASTATPLQVSGWITMPAAGWHRVMEISPTSGSHVSRPGPRPPLCSVQMSRVSMKCSAGICIASKAEDSENLEHPSTQCANPLKSTLSGCPGQQHSLRASVALRGGTTWIQTPGGTMLWIPEAHPSSGVPGPHAAEGRKSTGGGDRRLGPS